MINEKLKILKGKLRTWNQEVFGKVDLEVNWEVKYLNDLGHFVANESLVIDENIG